MTNQHTCKKYTDEEVSKILNLYQSGSSLKDITEIMRRKRNNIKNILIQNNVWVNKSATIEQKQLITELYNSGLSCSTISNKVKLGLTPIKNYLKLVNLIRPGYSNGVKIEFTDEQKLSIKNLYLIEKKNCVEISKLIGLNKSSISKYLTKSGFRRTKGEANSLYRTGKKRSESVCANIRSGLQEFAKSGKRKQYGGYCKYYRVSGLKCQGTYEKFYIEYLISKNMELPKDGENIITPFGVYYSDFSLGDELIEIKSDYTYDMLIGIKPNRFTNKIDTTQYEKIKWVNKNIKPVNIIVVDKKNNKLIKYLIL